MDTTERTRALITGLFDRIDKTGGYAPLLEALSDDLGDAVGSHVFGTPQLP